MTTSPEIIRKKRRVLLWIYGAALVYFALKLVYYYAFIQGFPDQQAQVSYVIDMCRNPALVPDFASMPVYNTVSMESGILTMRLNTAAVNYLGHPPLYYLLMSLTGSVQFLPDGVVSVNYLRLCACNMLLVCAGMILAFRLGYRRLQDRSPAVHALYAAALATLPELGYVAASVNNDNLAFFAFVLFFTGLLRYDEDKTDLKTYGLIGISFLLGSFSKLTMALMMAVALLAALVMSIFRTKSLKLITSRYFLATLPCYLLFLAYELVIHRRYGVWHPGLATVAPEYYLTTVFYVAPENRVSLTFLQYLPNFIRGIGYTWSSLYGHNLEASEAMNNRLGGLFVFFWIPVAAAFVSAVLQCVRRRCDRFTLPVTLAFVVTLLYQLWNNWSGFVRNGYLGGNQARYYLPMIVPFALILCERVPPLFRTKKARAAGTILALLLIACWLAGDAPRLLLTLGFVPQT